MAFDILSIPPMSAEYKRLFSAAGQMVSPLRTQIEASTIGIAQTLRSWVRNRLIRAEDSLIDTSKEVGHSIFHNQPGSIEFVMGARPDSDLETIQCRDWIDQFNSEVDALASIQFNQGA
jgi:hypothetical protein